MIRNRLVVVAVAVAGNNNSWSHQLFGHSQDWGRSSNWVRNSTENNRTLVVVVVVVVCNNLVPYSTEMDRIFPLIAGVLRFHH